MERIPTTADIEKCLMQRCKQECRMTPIAPSLVLPHGWEADVAAATKTGFIHEFEIKVSRSDFLADFRKNTYHQGVGKHERMAQRLHGKVIPGVNNERYLKMGHKLPTYWTPNYFWFCSPIGMLKPEDIPNYAGWLEFEAKYITPPWKNSYSYWQIVCIERRKAPRLHKEATLTYRVKDIFLARLTNIVTLGRGSNFDAVPAKITTKEAANPQISLFT